MRTIEDCFKEFLEKLPKEKRGYIITACADLLYLLQCSEEETEKLEELGYIDGPEDLENFVLAVAVGQYNYNDYYYSSVVKHIVIEMEEIIKQ